MVAPQTTPGLSHALCVGAGAVVASLLPPRGRLLALGVAAAGVTAAACVRSLLPLGVAADGAARDGAGASREPAPAATVPRATPDTHTLEPRSAERTPPSAPAAQTERIHVELSASEIDGNNRERDADAAHPLYSCTDALTGKPYVRPPLRGSESPVCSKCYRCFDSWSALYMHRAKPCYTDTPTLDTSARRPVRVEFGVKQLPHIADAVASMELELDENESGDFSVVVDECYLQIVLRRLRMAHATKYSLEAWYPALEALALERGRDVHEYTAPTVWLELGDEELVLLQKLCSVATARNLGMDTHERSDELNRREALESRINRALGAAALRSEAGGRARTRAAADGESEQTWCFCRLSTRCPKDGAVTSLAVDETPTLVARLQAQLQQLRVGSGYEVVELLSRSQRVYSDISEHFEYRLPATSSARMALSLRAWQPDMRPDCEFRCFVHEGRLAAISQRHAYYAFEGLQDVAHCRQVRAAITRFHADLAAAMPMASYVADIAVLLPAMACQLIEVSPFSAAMSGGAALYSWERDQRILVGQDDAGAPAGMPAMRVLRALTS